MGNDVVLRRTRNRHHSRRMCAKALTHYRLRNASCAVNMLGCAPMCVRVHHDSKGLCTTVCEARGDNEEIFTPISAPFWPMLSSWCRRRRHHHHRHHSDFQCKGIGGSQLRPCSGTRPQTFCPCGCGSWPPLAFSSATRALCSLGVRPAFTSSSK